MKRKDTNRGRQCKNDKGQLHTLEGFAASIIIVLGLVFASQSVAVTSTSTTTSSEDIEAQYERLAQDLLTQARSNGELKDVLLNWDPDQRKFVGSEDLYYYQGSSPPGELGRALDRAVIGNELAYNLQAEYKSGGSTLTMPIVDNGEPSSNSVSAEEVIVLDDNDELSDGTRLSNAEGYPMENMENEAIYNVVSVRITVWRR